MSEYLINVAIVRTRKTTTGTYQDPTVPPEYHQVELTEEYLDYFRTVLVELELAGFKRDKQMTLSHLHAIIPTELQDDNGLHK